MKFFAAAALALAALATATKECTPATYECTANGLGWEVCDVSGYWVVSSDSHVSSRKETLLTAG